MSSRAASTCLGWSLPLDRSFRKTALKRLFRESWNHTAEQGLALEAELQFGLIGSANQLAAVAAGMTGEPPAFVDS